MIDAAFALRLYRAAGARQSWRLGSMLDITHAGCIDAWSARAVLSRIYAAEDGIEHRAGPDAVRLLRALASETVPEVSIMTIDG